MRLLIFGPGYTATRLIARLAGQAEIATVTREPFRTTGRIGQLIENGWLFQPPVLGDRALNPETDRIMLCGSNAMIKDFAHMLEGHGFTEGSNANPGSFVLERAFVG